MSSFKYLRTFLLCIVMSLLYGCTVSSHIPNEDYTWSTVTINTTYQSAYRNIKNGVAKCESDWRVDSDLYTDIQEGVITISLKNLIFRNPHFVLAKITVTPNGNGSSIRIGIVTGMDENFAISRRTAKKVSAWANGSLDCQ
ncbi:hypothetical protein UFOVP14_3 [uncultured Caudovirales phage]|uniref:Lipoprotein n=1 Tax=uncultured Caudovirales phage TaxID=2100421 RepID=A0A6J5KKJ9_9CAUD|nr:hypothetical protein UFOVP14_3 [uncultured Caudovirales phage]